VTLITQSLFPFAYAHRLYHQNASVGPTNRRAMSDALLLQALVAFGG
jgi:hypothetical protein